MLDEPDVAATNRFSRYAAARADRGIRRVTVRLSPQAADGLDFLTVSLPVVAPSTAEAAAFAFRVAAGLLARPTTQRIVDAGSAVGVRTTDLVAAAAGLSVLLTPIDDVIRRRVPAVRRTPLRTSVLVSSSDLAALSECRFGSAPSAVVGNAISTVAPAFLCPALLLVTGQSDNPEQVAIDRLSIGLSRAAREQALLTNSGSWLDDIDCALDGCEFEA